MRFAPAGYLALALLCGCVRLGYNAHKAPEKPKPDASHEDAGARDKDAGSDAATRMDAGANDASMRADAAAMDAATDAAMQDSGSKADDGSLPDDGGADSGSAPDGGAPDGGSPDSGSNDAAMPDAEVDSGAENFCPERTDAVLCDDFEDSSLDRWQYSVLTSGTVAQTTSRGHKGSGSLYATIGAASIRNSEARRGTAAFPHVKSGDIWVRYFYYVPSSVVINQGISTVVVAEIEEPYFGFSFIIRPSGVDIGVGNTMYSSTATFPRDKWACVELHVKIDPNAGYFEAYLDQTLVKQSPLVDTEPDMGYSSIDVGIHYGSPPQNAAQAYVDDVIAGYQRYGCN